MRKTLNTAGLVVVHNNQLLLTYSKNKKAWYLPGGKLDIGETSLEALIREIKEELNVDLNPNQLHYYMHISAVAYGENQKFQMEQDCFLHPFISHLKPSAEIEAFAYMDYEEYKKQTVQVEGVIVLFEQLLKDNRIN